MQPNPLFFPGHFSHGVIGTDFPTPLHSFSRSTPDRLQSDIDQAFTGRSGLTRANERISWGLPTTTSGSFSFTECLYWNISRAGACIRVLSVWFTSCAKHCG